MASNKTTLPRCGSNLGYGVGRSVRPPKSPAGRPIHLWPIELLPIDLSPIWLYRIYQRRFNRQPISHLAGTFQDLNNYLTFLIDMTHSSGLN